MREFFIQYANIAEIIQKTFGSECEVVLHDLKMPEHSVIYVVNNTVTGREIGDSFSQLVNVMYSKQLANNYIDNYYFRAPNGKLIKSSTVFLFGDDGDLEGAMCINCDTSRILDQIGFLQAFLPNCSEIQKTEGVHDEVHVKQVVTSLIDSILRDSDVQHLSRDARIEKIRFMEEKGIFLMKGAIEHVAEKMGINKVTVYGYLDEIRGKR